MVDNPFKDYPSLHVLFGGDLHLRGAISDYFNHIYLGVDTAVQTVHCDAIVNAAHRSLRPGSGVSGDVWDAMANGNPKNTEPAMSIINLMLEKYKHLGSIVPPGTTWTTPPGALPCKKVLHCVGPDMAHYKTDRDKMHAGYLLRRAYTSALDQCLLNGLHSVAFPSISTGIFHFEHQPATLIAIDAIYGWMIQHPAYPIEVLLCTYSEEFDPVTRHGGSNTPIISKTLQDYVVMRTNRQSIPVLDNPDGIGYLTNPDSRVPRPPNPTVGHAGGSSAAAISDDEPEDVSEFSDGRGGFADAIEVVDDDDDDPERPPAVIEDAMETRALKTSQSFAVQNGQIPEPTVRLAVAGPAMPPDYPFGSDVRSIPAFAERDPNDAHPNQHPEPVVLASNLVDIFNFLVQDNTAGELETGAFIIAKPDPGKKDGWLATEIFLPLQDDHRGHWAELEDPRPDMLRHKWSVTGQRQIGIIHTHPTFPVFLSTVDVHAIGEGFQTDQPSAFSIIINGKPGGVQRVGYLRLTNRGIDTLHCGLPNHTQHQVHPVTHQPLHENPTCVMHANHITLEDLPVTVHDFRDINTVRQYTVQGFTKGLPRPPPPPPPPPSLPLVRPPPRLVPAHPPLPLPSQPPSRSLARPSLRLVPAHPPLPLPSQPWSSSQSAYGWGETLDPAQSSSSADPRPTEWFQAMPRQRQPLNAMGQANAPPLGIYPGAPPGLQPAFPRASPLPRQAPRVPSTPVFFPLMVPLREKNGETQ